MNPLKVLMCTVPQDADLRSEIESHFALLEHQKLIELLDERTIAVGKESDAERLELVRQADVVLLLVSPALMGSMKRNIMLQQSLERFVKQEILLIPVIIRPTDWQEYSFGKLVSLPRDGRAVTQWGSRDEAWVAITRDLREVVLRQRSKLSARPSQLSAASPNPGPGSQSKGATSFAQGYALIIGTGGPGIEVTERDAEAIHALLCDPKRAGYPANQARLLKGAAATRQNILSGLDHLAAQVQKNLDGDSTVIIYFSGHGLRNGGQHPLYYLLPHGYQAGIEAETAISGAEFSAKIAAIPARKLIVFLDCCHAAGVPKSPPGFVPAPLPPDLEERLGRGSGLVIVASSREDEKSYTGNNYSVFTTCLLEALDGKGSTDGYARVLNVLGHLMQTVPEMQPKQHPIIKKLLDVGENFALCYNGQAVASTAPAGVSGRPISSQRPLMERELAGLQETVLLLADKRNRLRKRQSFETSVSVQFQIEQELIEVEKLIAEQIDKIDVLESQLQNR